MLADYHLHSWFSGDSEENPEHIIEKAIALGMKYICFTDHNDFDFPGEIDFTLDADGYFDALSVLRERYRDRLEIGIGIEAGLEPEKSGPIRQLIERYPFDFVIGSTHLINRKDPYYPDFFEGRNSRECLEEYFLAILDTLKVCGEFDVYGHLDYIVRYTESGAQQYSYNAFHDLLDEILGRLIEKGKGIEVNSGGFRNGLDFPNPHPDVLRRYRELGGEILTVGSDAHKVQQIGSDFDRIAELIKSCGFSYYTVYRNRKPEFIPV